jgi:hypothetical protein
MKTRKPNARRPLQRTRLTVRPRSLEECGFDELDEWMVACPAGEAPHAAN